jgi:heptosyltransferase-1
MGDVLHGLPAVCALRERSPECFIGWAVEPRWKDLLASESAAPIVNRIHPVPTREWKRRPFTIATLREIATLRREMKAERYDVCVDLQGSIRSAVIGRMAEAKRFLGPRRPAERQAKALYAERIDTHATHVIEQACELIGAAAGSSNPLQALRPARVKLPVNAAAEAWCEAELDRAEVGERGFVLLAPTAGWGAKQWPVEQYQKLAERLRQAGFRVLVNAGSAGDVPVTSAVADAGCATLVQCDLAQLVALTRRATLVVGGDTGPVHLGAALGRPVVALFGPTDPRRNGPDFPGAAFRVLRHASSHLSHARVAETEAGLAQISVDEVVAAAFVLLQEHSGEVRAHG